VPSREIARIERFAARPASIATQGKNGRETTPFTTRPVRLVAYFAQKKFDRNQD